MPDLEQIDQILDWEPDRFDNRRIIMKTIFKEEITNERVIKMIIFLFYYKISCEL